MAGPLLSASWYRVAELKPRMRSHARMQRHRRFDVLLEGVKRRRGGTMTTESVVMRASTGTVRWVRTEHRID